MGELVRLRHRERVPLLPPGIARLCDVDAALADIELCLSLSSQRLDRLRVNSPCELWDSEMAHYTKLVKERRLIWQRRQALLAPRFTVLKGGLE